MPAIPPLVAGDRMSRDEFERRYDAMPGLKKAELIDGVVYMPSPVRITLHGEPHIFLDTWLGTYRAATPGTRAGTNTTARLSLDNEPQPDALLLIDPACGGQAQINPNDYVELAPELVAEVSASTASFDLNSKLDAYCRNGVREYLVWRVLDRQFDWFARRGHAFEHLVPGSDGILRSEVFPGLWLDSAALLRGDMLRVLDVVRQGSASDEHSRFVERLAQARG